jgi:tripartite-type tricarboxylate transporter receptor subunit TctC
MAGINIVHVPYKGSPPALTSVLSGETSMLFSPLTIAIPHTKSGKLRAIGVTTAKRSKLVPELPTIAESGLPGYEVTQWYGMQAPAGTPKDIIARINGEVGKILAMPDIGEKLVLFGAEAAPSTPEFMTAYVKSEVEKWAKVVKASGAKAD